LGETVSSASSFHPCARRAAPPAICLPAPLVSAFFGYRSSLDDWGGFFGVFFRFETQNRRIFSTHHLGHEEGEIDSPACDGLRNRVSQAGFVVTLDQQSRNSGSAQARCLGRRDQFLPCDRINFNRRPSLATVAVSHHYLEVGTRPGGRFDSACKRSRLVLDFGFPQGNSFHCNCHVQSSVLRPKFP